MYDYTKEQILQIGSILNRMEEFLMSDRSKKEFQEFEDLAPSEEFKSIFHTLLMQGYSCGLEDQKEKYERLVKNRNNKIKALEEKIGKLKSINFEELTTEQLGEIKEIVEREEGGINDIHN